MKAGSLLDDDAVALRESRASPSSVEVCLEVCLGTPRGLPARGPRSSLAHLSAFIYFLAQMDCGSEISNMRFEI